MLTVSDPVAIDPTLLALLSIFGAAIVATFAGLVGAALQGARDHRRWLRERRLEAFADLFSLVTETASFARESRPLVAESQVDLARSEALRADASPSAQAEVEQIVARAVVRREKLQELNSRLEASMAQTVQRLTLVSILGPESVGKSGGRVLDARDGTDAELTAAISALLTDMRKALKIKA